MKWVLIILLNFFIGAVVWALIDDDKESFYKWYGSADPGIAWFVQLLTLFCWPVGLYFWLRNKFY